jgi:hypothetical protein
LQKAIKVNPTAHQMVWHPAHKCSWMKVILTTFCQDFLKIV